MGMNEKRKGVVFVVAVVAVILISTLTALYMHKKNSAFGDTNITNKANEVKDADNLSSYVIKYEEEFSEYVLGENENDYNYLMEKCKNLIDSEDEMQINSMKSLLELFKDKVIEENKENLNEQVKAIEDADLTILGESRLSEIDKKVSDFKKLIKDEKFSTADSEIKELINTIESEAKEIRLRLQAEGKEVPRPLNTADGEELILKEDGNFVNDLLAQGAFLVAQIYDNVNTEIYGINEPVLKFDLINSKLEDMDYLQAFYYVGKKTKNVYRCSELGGAGGDLYFMKNNKIEEKIKYREPVLKDYYMDIYAYDARVILDKAYPEYTCMNGGEVSEVLNLYTGFDEHAYCFRYMKNGTKDVYVGAVFSDKTFSFKFAGTDN